MEDETKKALLVGACFLMAGIAIGAYAETTINKDANTYLQYRVDLMNACNQGCYNDLYLALYENETVEGTFPKTFAACRSLCVEQYGL